jgi:hypothetical protein
MIDGYGPPTTLRPEFERIGDDRIVGSFSWAGDGRFAVLKIRNEQIADMEVFDTRTKALRFARRAG